MAYRPDSSSVPYYGKSSSGILVSSHSLFPCHLSFAFVVVVLCSFFKAFAFGKIHFTTTLPIWFRVGSKLFAALQITSSLLSLHLIPRSLWSSKHQRTSAETVAVAATTATTSTAAAVSARIWKRRWIIHITSTSTNLQSKHPSTHRSRHWKPNAEIAHRAAKRWWADPSALSSECSKDGSNQVMLRCISPFKDNVAWLTVSIVKRIVCNGFVKQNTASRSSILCKDRSDRACWPCASQPLTIHSFPTNSSHQQTCQCACLSICSTACFHYGASVGACFSWCSSSVLGHWSSICAWSIESTIECVCRTCSVHSGKQSNQTSCSWSRCLVVRVLSFISNQSSANCSRTCRILRFF